MTKLYISPSLSIQCYKSSKDHSPQMELTLSGCSITHIPKDGKKKKHELKIVHQGADALVLAVQSKEQAEEWLKVKHYGVSLLMIERDVIGCIYYMQLEVAKY